MAKGMWRKEAFSRKMVYSPCVSLGKMGLTAPDRLRRAASLADTVKWVELRFDLAAAWRSKAELDVETTVSALSRFAHRIAVCHSASNELSPKERKSMLGRAVAAGCDAVDIDWLEERDYPAAFYRALSQRHIRRIRSLHLNGPIYSPRTLRMLIGRMRRGRPYIVKIVAPCRSRSQVDALQSCYDGKKDLLLIASGRIGRASRIAATAAGARFTYVHAGEPTGSGQMSFEEYRNTFTHGSR